MGKPYIFSKSNTAIYVKHNPSIYKKGLSEECGVVLTFKIQCNTPYKQT